MDRSWINSRLFSKPHLDGVSNFMKFVSERYDENEEILCPCRRCLNRIHQHKGIVEDHLYIHGMASTYTRWIYHGEAMDVQSNENADHLDGHIDFSDDVGMNEVQEDDDDDKIHDMVEELYVAEEEGNKKKSMFAVLLEEMKQKLYPGAAHSRFSCGEVTSYKVILSNKQCCIHCITKVVIISIPRLLYSLFLPGSKETYSCVGTRI